MRFASITRTKNTENNHLRSAMALNVLSCLSGLDVRSLGVVGVFEQPPGLIHLNPPPSCTSEQDQYADRCLYWALRHASRLRDNVLVIIIDSMDKTKFAWPRYPWSRISKDLADVPRPRMIFTAAIAHGFHKKVMYAPG